MIEILMDEEEWLNSTDARRLIEHVHPQEWSWSRKLLLLNCASCRHLAPWFPDGWLAQAIDRAERWADSGLTQPTLEKWAGIVTMVRRALGTHSDAAVRATAAVQSLFSDRNTTYPPIMHAWRALCIDQTIFGPEFASTAPEIGLRLIRDIFANPFRPISFDVSWHTATAVAIARQMYESRDFAAMPILADALQEAGCENEDILDHCRAADGVHVRGCWVVDHVLNKS